MTPKARALLKRFVVEIVRREMTDEGLGSYDDRNVRWAKTQVWDALEVEFAALTPEDFRG
jgi:hypothetical protein